MTTKSDRVIVLRAEGNDIQSIDNRGSREIIHQFIDEQSVQVIVELWKSSIDFNREEDSTNSEGAVQFNRRQL